MPRVDCIKVGKEFGREFEVYIREAPSGLEVSFLREMLES